MAAPAGGGPWRFPAVFMRGGTSKGLFFRGGVLPDDPAERDRVLIRALGAGDPYGTQIDGLGGATSSTSKAVIVSRSGHPGFDVDYLFAQVSVATPTVDWAASCGNLAAAVGPFAIQEGLADAGGELTRVRIWQQNTAKEIVAHVPTPDGVVLSDGDFLIDGVAYPAAPIRLDFIDPGGAITGRLLPTGRPADELSVPGIGTVPATMIDASNPCVFVPAEALGFDGTELPGQVNADRAALDRLEAVRSEAAVLMGLAANAREASASSPANPKVALVSPPRAYTASSGRIVGQTDIDIVVRMLSMGRLHHAVPGTGGIALAVAVLIPGTTPSQAAAGHEGDVVRIGHSSGVLPVAADVGRPAGQWEVTRATVWRSARRLMEGTVLVPAGAPLAPSR
jgi:probable AcnD-accessory protein PrpF